MSIYANIKRCLELSDRDLASAVGDRRLAKALLDQLAKVSRPGDGAPKLLLVFARMAMASVDWIDGGLRVEMNGEGEITTVEVLSELGLGMRERVFPSFKMAVPLDEFVRAVERVPHMITPLTIATVSEQRLVLTAVAEGEDAAGDDAVDSAAVSIGDDSLYTGERRRSKAAGKHPESDAPPSEAKKPARRSSRPKSDSVRPRVIAPNSGKTLRPMAPPMASVMETQQGNPAPPPRVAGVPVAPRVAPPAVVPRAPPLPRTDERAPQPTRGPVVKRAIVARVPLTKIQVAKGGGARTRDEAPEAGVPQTRRGEAPVEGPAAELQDAAEGASRWPRRMERAARRGRDRRRVGR